jgi:hypothetical protein
MAKKLVKVNRQLFKESASLLAGAITGNITTGLLSQLTKSRAIAGIGVAGIGLLLAYRTKDKLINTFAFGASTEALLSIIRSTGALSGTEEVIEAQTL